MCYKMSSSKVILVLGGNGFIGAETVKYLLDHTDYQLVLLNRGHWNDWDNKKQVLTRITENIIWDRKTDSIKDSLQKYLENDEFKFEAIIDLSAYKKKDVKRVLRDIPNHRFKVYVLISSDSVYEVSVEKEGEGFFEECDAIRPESEELVSSLKKADSYGHHKFGCEEGLLGKSIESGNLNYLILRVSDVIGARDSTERFWFYQMWLQYLKDTNAPDAQHEISIPKEYFNTKTSFTYVKDIARCIYSLLDSNIRNETFNICCDTPMSLIDFHSLLADTIKLVKPLEYKLVNEDKYDYHLFPSVTKGASTAKKLEKMLGFKPTDIRIAFKETVDFYNDAYLEFPTERRDIEKSLKKVFFKRTDCSRFDEFIRDKIEKFTRDF